LIPLRRLSTDRGHRSPSTWSWQVIPGCPSSSQRRHTRWCAAFGDTTTRSRPVPSARFASPSAACCSAVTLRTRTGVLASSFILEAGGFDSPLVHPSGLDYPAHCAASETSLVRAPMLEPHPRPCTAPALTVCCLPSRLAGCSSSPPRTTTILGSLGISGASCTHLPAHIWRADASVRTESARRVDFARVDGRVRGSGWDPYGLRVPM
jgi:hypothetical protein